MLHYSITVSCTLKNPTNIPVKRKT